MAWDLSFWGGLLTMAYSKSISFDIFDIADINSDIH